MQNSITDDACVTKSVSFQVFPREYRRALTELAEEEAAKKNVGILNSVINGETNSNGEKDDTIESVAKVTRLSCNLYHFA